MDIKAIRELHRAGQLDAAKAAYLDRLRKNPRDIESLHSLGILSAQEENYNAAIDYLIKALAIQPDNAVISLHLANVFKIQGQLQPAIELLEKAILSNKDYAALFNNLGTLYYAQEKFPKSVELYQLAIEKQFDYADAFYNLGLAQGKLGQLKEASATFEKLLLLSPDHFAALFQLARLHMQQQDIAKAIELFLEIEKAQPNHFETQTNLATCYLKKGLLNEAKQHYIKALALNPDDSQILFNLGVINMQQGEVDLAIQYYQRAIPLATADFALHNNLGVAFLAKHHVQFALQHFQDASLIQPNNKAIQHTIDVLSSHKHLLSSPPDYIKSLFDSYADHYDSHLREALEYKVPELLLESFLKVRKRQTSYDIIDLGCGTGLCGELFKPYATNLVGVDLSPNMLALAAQKNIYDELVESELVSFLNQESAHVDLIIAGDVLVYIGDLAALFKAIYHALRDHGLFIFNTEISETVDFEMNQSGRFSHEHHYIKKMAENNNLRLLDHTITTTRLQNNIPVKGHLIMLEKKYQ